ncbi:MAG TPA: YbdK family carboxylate-amine ligase [Gaiellaceae bacterium]|nr:YbdK family carboxylate-amine ligase [Gaiellaceae bacterium]
MLVERLTPAEATRWESAQPLTGTELRRLFDGRSALTVGLEEELMLLDPVSLELSPSAELALERLAGDARFGHELREGQVELRSPPCGNAVAAAVCLAEARLRLHEGLEGRLLLAASGTHPFSARWGAITAERRYRDIADEYPHAARGHLPCALHVHVAVPGADRALAVYNAARSYVPEFAALAANSPFLDGEDTGLASARSQLGFAPHRSGVPPVFESWEHFAGFVAWGRRGGVFPDASHLWWDLRPHTRFGTLELRVPDAQTRLEDAAAVAAVFQALLAWLAARVDAGERLPVHETSRIAENAWRAARDGERGWLVDLDTGEPVAARARISLLLDALEPAAESLRTTWALRGARALLADNGADRQRYVAARDGARGLTRWLARETVVSARDYLEQRG